MRRFGAFLFTSQFDGLSETQVLAAALRYARIAEDSGFDDLWVNEHHFIPYGVNPSATTLAAFLLGRTSRMRVGTAVVLLPQLPPVFVAEQAALLDHLSDGRFDLGVGRGGPTVDLTVAGRGFAHWAQGFWPAVDLMLAAWTGKASADDELNRFPEVTVKPTPRSGSRPPLFVASVSDSSVEQAARRGLPLLLFLQETDESRRAKVQRWARIAARHGHDVRRPGHAFAVIWHVTEPGESLDVIGDNLHAFFVQSSADYMWLPEAATFADPGGGRHTTEQLRGHVDQILATHPVGSAETCTDRLRTTMEVSGIDRVLIMLEAGAEPARVAANIAAFGATVLPALRRP